MKTKSGLRIGVARLDINPPDAKLLTQTGMGRLQPTRGFLDDLFVEAMAIEVNGEAAFVFTSDLRTVTPKWVIEIRAALGMRTGCDPRRILLSSNHNHSSSPEPYKPSAAAKKAELRANQKIVRAFIDAAMEAWESRRPAEIGFAKAELQEPIGENRHQRLSSGVAVQCWNSGSICPPGQKLAFAGGPHPTEIRILSVREAGAKHPFAVLTSYPSHIHLAELPYFSGEAAGAVKRHLQQRLGHGVIAMYANSTAGDVDMHCVHPLVQGSVERRVAWFKKAQRIIGERFANAVAPAVEKIAHYTRPGALRHTYYCTGEKTHSSDNTSITLVQSLCLGDIALVTIPGEIFVNYHYRIAARFPKKKYLLLSYNGSTNAYIPEPIGFEIGGYEVMRGSAERGENTILVSPTWRFRRARPETGDVIEAQVFKALSKCPG